MLALEYDSLPNINPSKRKMGASLDYSITQIVTQEKGDTLASVTLTNEQIKARRGKVVPGPDHSQGKSIRSIGGLAGARVGLPQKRNSCPCL